MVKDAGAAMTNKSQGRLEADRIRQHPLLSFVWVGGGLLFTVLSGIVIWLAPFSDATQMAVLSHTAIGALLLASLVMWLRRHWLATREQTSWTGNIDAYAAFWLLALCIVSGLAVTYQGLFGIVITHSWASLHLWTGLLTAAVVSYHVFPREHGPETEKEMSAQSASSNHRTLENRCWKQIFAAAIALCMLPIAGVLAYRLSFSPKYQPPDSFQPTPGPNPFAPSNTESETGKPISPQLTGSSQSCGTAGCHAAIYEEWLASAHRWSEQDEFFQAVRHATTKVQGVHATEKCGGCHAPLTMLAGYKDPQLGKETPGYNEGVSCVICHAVRSVDERGIGSYRLGIPKLYLYERNESRPARLITGFLMRVYPQQHVRDYDLKIVRQAQSCAPCHKEFDVVDNYPELLQVETQYDDWKNNRWNTDPVPNRRLLCQQCHMAYRDTANRAQADPYDLRIGLGAKYHDHRFAAANQYMPVALSLPAAAEQSRQVEKWLKGEQSIREIENVWPDGPLISIAIHTPASVQPGEKVGLQIALTNKKVGHSFPTGPLNLVRVWLKLEVRDQHGRAIFHSGRLDGQNHLEDETYVLRPIAITQDGQSIMTADIWHPKGPRYRPAIGPGATESFDYHFSVPRQVVGPLSVNVQLRYRKANQFFMEAVYPDQHRAAPITDIASASGIIGLD